MYTCAQCAGEKRKLPLLVRAAAIQAPELLRQAQPFGNPYLLGGQLLHAAGPFFRFFTAAAGRFFAAAAARFFTAAAGRFFAAAAGRFSTAFVLFLISV